MSESRLPRRPVKPLERDVIATVALALYSVTVAMGSARVFSGWSFLGDMALIVVVGHGFSLLLRRSRVPWWTAEPLNLLVMLWLVTVLYYRSTLSWLMPTADTWDLLTLEIRIVQNGFQSTVAPVLYGTGWAVLASFGLVMVVWLSDLFAFRAEARGESLVPGAVLFVFISALGNSRLRVELTMLLIGTAVVAAVALRALHDPQRRVELRANERGARFAAPLALGTALALALVAGFVGPRIPGADAEPLYETRGRGGGVTQVLSPLVSIRSRLVNQSPSELFRVNANVSSYWRIATLPNFDGETFGLKDGVLENADGRFDDGAAGSVEILQQYQILNLGGELAPAAADPVAFSGLDLRIERDTSILITDEADLTSGDVFTVLSASPRPDIGQLQRATASSPPDSIYLELPDSYPSLASELALAVTAGATSPYEQALALQAWFTTSGEFRYSLEAQTGHGSDAIESFLRERVGYCEQFSATFASMARSLGIPSRVAVGFTPGELDDEGWYVVRGLNAHAWPELWFDGIGWLYFEATPGRGAPGAEPYTGVPAQQETEAIDATGRPVSEVTTPPRPTTPATVVPPENVDTPPSVTTPSAGGAVPAVPDEPPPSTDQEGGFPWRVSIVGGMLAMAVAMPEIARLLRRRVDRRAAPSVMVTRAWQRATAAAQRAGVVGSPAFTAHEWADATAGLLPIAARPMDSLASVVDAVTFAQPGTVEFSTAGVLGTTIDHDCVAWSHQVQRIADDTLSPGQRLRNYFTVWR